jgi:hypothetical protein
MVVWRIFGLKADKVTGGLRKLRNKVFKIRIPRQILR